MCQISKTKFVKDGEKRVNITCCNNKLLTFEAKSAIIKVITHTLLYGYKKESKG